MEYYNIKKENTLCMTGGLAGEGKRGRGSADPEDIEEKMASIADFKNMKMDKADGDASVVTAVIEGSSKFDAKAWMASLSVPQ